MAFIISRDETFLWCYKNVIHFYDWRGSVSHSVVSLPSLDKKEAKESNNSSDVNEPAIECIALSTCGSLLGVCDNEKRLLVYEKASSNEWCFLSTRLITKRATKLEFSNDDQYLLVAERSGCVYKYSTKAATEDSDEPIMGHLSMVLDMIISDGGKFLITSDRDEKIRVSHYPNAYNIESYCLGHEEFVSCMDFIHQKPELLLSGSGDGTLKLWNYANGQVKVTQSIVDDFKDVPQSSSSRNSDSSKNGDEQSKDGYQQKEDYVAAKFLKCSPASSLCAVVCERYKCTNLYTIDYENRNKEAIKWFEKIDGYVHCLTFDKVGRLWILKPLSEGGLQVYQPVECGGKIKFKPLGNESAAEKRITEVVSSIQKDMNSIGEFAIDDQKFVNFYKQQFDNVQDYMKKKQERIEQQIKKFKGS